MGYFDILPTARELYAEITGKKKIKYKEYAKIVEKKIQIAKEELETECEIKGVLEKSMCDELKKLGYQIRFEERVNKNYTMTVTIISWNV